MAKGNRTAVPGSFMLVWQALITIRKFWKPLGGILLVYLLAYLFFASGLSNIGSVTNDIKAELETAEDGRLSRAAGSFGLLLASGSDSSQVSSILQTIMIILVSLVIIWALRHLLAGHMIGVKQAYYNAMAPLIPFLLILVVIFIQLLPVTLGSIIINSVLSTIFNQSSLLTIISIIIFLVLAAWSLYMLTRSIMALYIVTLPDMQPMAALRSAKKLVQYRRWRIARRIIFLPIFILLVMAALVIPLILLAPSFVVSVFYLLSALTILFSHTYLYGFYRTLLDHE